MNDDTRLDRRKFFGAAGYGLLAASTWLAGCLKRGAPAKAEKPPLDDRFTYDVSQFEHTDPAQLLYRETAQIPTGFQNPKCLAVAPNDHILVGGDQAINVFGKDGQFRSTIKLAATPHALCADNSRAFVALKDHLEIFDSAGTLAAKSDSCGERAHLTAVANAADAIFVADAGNREILRCDTSGKVLARFGKAGSGDGNPGFVIPSPYFHVLVGPDGLLWVNNPGRHRIEAYTTDGKYELGWGKPSMAVDGFCGCCNPVYFTRLPNGKFVTSEKGLNRIKIYSVKGDFEGVVAGPEHLVKDLELAKKACADCQIGFGFDVAADSQSRVLALDPATRAVRIFTAKSA